MCPSKKDATEKAILDDTFNKNSKRTFLPGDKNDRF